MDIIISTAVSYEGIVALCTHGCYSHNAVILHCLDKYGDWWCFALQTLECLNGPTHKTMFTLHTERENNDQLNIHKQWSDRVSILTLFFRPLSASRRMTS